MVVSFCLPHAVARSALLFVEICVRVLRCCECVCYMSFGSKVRLIIFDAMGSTVLFILMFKLLLYSAGSGVNRVQVVLFGFSYILSRQKLCIGMVVCIYWMHSCLWVYM